MEIEYIYPNDSRSINEEIRQIKKENTLGCLVMGLFLLSGLFIFLSILPAILLVVGYSIIFLTVYIVYKAYLEDFVLSLIQRIRHK
ncbi:MAG: hypothetical protein IKW58_00755 [Alphaproteobacteria bacterium]|nr:hypothetical protein [Alphaproteobacteria bacterium]